MDAEVLRIPGPSTAQKVNIVDGIEQTPSVFGSRLKIGPCITKDSQQDFDEIQDRIFDALFTTKGQVREPDFACGQQTTLFRTSTVVTLARNQNLAGRPLPPDRLPLRTKPGPRHIDATLKGL